MTPTLLAEPIQRPRPPMSGAGSRSLALSAITETDSSIAIWQRPVDALVQRQAADLAAREHLAIRLHLTLAQIASGVAAPLTAQCAALSAMGEWLADMQRLADDFAALARPLAGQGTLTLRLETVSDDGCRRFHVDRVQLRMLCTYLGPGTEWLPEAQVDREALAAHQPNELILRRGSPQRLAPFWVAILKGEVYPGQAGRGQVHRSPPMAGTGATRVLFCMDV